jgi:hypothetical protein
MDKTQKSKVNMFIAMVLFFGKYTAAFTGFVQLITEITGFTNGYASLQGEIADQGVTVSGITTNKDDLLDAAIKLLVQSARKARAWAVNVGNATLAAQFDVQISTFDHMSQGEVLNALTTINTAISANIASLVNYNVVAANVTAITTAIAAAQVTIGTPKQAITTKAVATKQIVIDIDNCDGFLAQIDDLLVPEYEDTNPTMVAEYRLSRELQPIGVHPTGLLANCKDSVTKALLEGVSAVIVEPDKTGVSDIDGNVEIERMKPGKYHVVFSLAGYIDYTVIIDFLQGKIQTVGVLMVAV